MTRAITRLSKLALGAGATIKKSIRESHLLTSEEERKGAKLCQCGRGEWHIYDGLAIECTSCGSIYENHGAYGLSLVHDAFANKESFKEYLKSVL